MKRLKNNNSNVKLNEVIVDVRTVFFIVVDSYKALKEKHIAKKVIVLSYTNHVLEKYVSFNRKIHHLFLNLNLVGFICVLIYAKGL